MTCILCTRDLCALEIIVVSKVQLITFIGYSTSIVLRAQYCVTFSLVISAVLGSYLLLSHCISRPSHCFGLVIGQRQLGLIAGNG